MVMGVGSESIQFLLEVDSKVSGLKAQELEFVNWKEIREEVTIRELRFTTKTSNESPAKDLVRGIVVIIEDNSNCMI